MDTAHAWPLTLALVGTKLETAPEEDVCCQPRFTGLPPFGCSTCQLAAAVPAQRWHRDHDSARSQRQDQHTRVVRTQCTPTAHL